MGTLDDLKYELYEKHWKLKYNWTGVSIPTLARMYHCGMDDACRLMMQIQSAHPKPKNFGESTCTSPKCGMTIAWIKTLAGERMCVNPGIQTIVDKDTGEVMKGFTPYWATCKDPDFFRKKKKK